MQSFFEIGPVVLCFVPSFFEIGPVVLEKKVFKLRQCVFAIALLSLLGEGCGPSI